MAEETRERSTTTLLLVVNNGSGTLSPIINQAPNTVRRYVYNGSAWECLY